MKPKKSKIAIVDKHRHWWKNSSDVDKWAVQDKKGDWWLISGSEFPEKKVKQVNEEEKIRESSGTLLHVTIIVLASILGVSLALNLIFSLGFFN